MRPTRDEYVRATLVPRSEPVPEGFRVWLDVTFKNLTEHAISGWRTGGMTVIDPAGLRRLRDFEGRRVNRMVAGEWGGGTDGPVKLPGGTRTTMIMGDGKNQPLVLSFEQSSEATGSASPSGSATATGAAMCRALHDRLPCTFPSGPSFSRMLGMAVLLELAVARATTISSISSTARSGRP